MLRSIDGELTAFRTAWLRAIALAWEDQAFLRAVTRKPVAALKKYLGYDWPWDGSSNDVDPKDKKPGSVSSNLLELKVVDQTQFRWVGDDWVWPTNAELEDSLTLRLPLRPDKIAKKDRARALADYYEAKPSIFGTAAGGGMTPRGRSLVTSAAIDITDHPSLSVADFLLTKAPVRFAGHHGPPGGFVPSGGDFLNFEVVVLAALAKAWDNTAFAELLETNEDLTTALQSIRGFTSPWMLTLKIENDETATWVPNSRSGNKIKPSLWEKLRPAVLSLNLPARPEQEQDQPIALAAYNSTGAEFPFTCCA